MDWNGNLRMPYVSRADTSNLSFLYNCTTYEQFPPAPVLEMKQQSALMAMDPKKKRLSNEQLELLENSFQEDIKLDPDRKMKLAKDLGLQPRQIAVWFQNRRARWKGKQLERLYDALKQEYDTVARDKHKLQQEVLALRAILMKDEVAKKQVSADISGEETVESTSMNPSFEKTSLHVQINAAECNYPLNMVDDYNNTVMMPAPYWPPS